MDRTPRSPVVWLWHGMIVVGWIFILSGIGLFVWTCLVWLKDGVWALPMLEELWREPPIDEAYGGGQWSDLQGLHLILHRLLHGLGRVPTSLALLAIGLGLAWSGAGRLFDRDDMLRRRRPAARSVKR